MYHKNNPNIPLMTNDIDDEIIRLTDLRKGQNEVYKQKIMKVKFLISLWGNAPDDLKENVNDKLVLIEDYYNASDKFLETKILFFTYYNQNAFPEKFIDRMNEGMTDWVTCGWAYLGMDEHEKQRVTVMKEFEFFKKIINSTPVIKKKTRRSGKKHRK